jgi:branched-chain amino acid transport system ATP-binding protein
MTLLRTQNLSAYYGDFQALFGINVSVEEGETVAVIGANGAGKSTTLKTLAGVLHPRSGSIRFDGEPIELLPSHTIAGRGLQLVPEERRQRRRQDHVPEGTCRGAGDSAGERHVRRPPDRPQDTP